MKLGKLTKTLLVAMPLMVSAAQFNSQIGQGILEFDQEAGFKDRCINITPEQVVGEKVLSTSYYLNLVKTREQLYDKISEKTSVEGSYGLYSGSAKASFVKEVKWNQNSNYILVRAVRVSYKHSISAEKTLLTDFGRKLMMDSKFRFLQSCGNRFAKTVNYGGEIFGVIEINSSTYEEKRKIERSLEASGSYGGVTAEGSTSYKRIIKEVTDKYAAKVNFRHVGGSQVEVPTDVDGLLNISSKIEAITDANPVAISVETRDYSTLANFVHDDLNYETMIRQDSIDFAQGKLREARTLYANIQTVLEYSQSFKRFNEQRLLDKLTYLDKKIVELKEFVAKSYSFLNESDPTTIEIDLDFELPVKKRRGLFRRRQVELPYKCEMKRDVLCGVESYKKQKSSACNVLGVHKGTGPQCGTVYKLKTSPACGIKSYAVSRGRVCGVERYKKCHHKACGKRPFPHNGRKKCRTSGCGVERFKKCANPAFGVAAYNSCRHPSHGVEKYLSCSHKDFGYKFDSCQHLSHGPDKYKSCEVAKVGSKTTFCPTL